MPDHTYVAVAVHNFSCSQPLPKGKRFLSFLIGQKVRVVSTNGTWAYGFCVDDERNNGIFPLSAVERPTNGGAASSSCNGLGEPSNSSSESAALVDEITAVLQNWWRTCKEYYAKQLSVASLEKIFAYMNDLMVVRKQILSGNVPAEELKEIRIKTTAKIDLGNQWLGLDMTIRDSGGKPIDIDSISLIQCFREHVISKKRIEEASRPQTDRKYSSFSILVNVLSTTLEIGCDCEFVMSLYDLKVQRFVSEDFTFRWTAKTAAFEHRDCRVLFTGLGESDASGEHRMIVVLRASRIAPIESSSSTMKKLPEYTGLPCYRQPYAVGFIDLAELIGGEAPKETIFFLSREDSFESLVSSLVSAKMSTVRLLPSFSSNGYAQKTQVMINSQFMPGPYRQVKKSFPHIFSVRPPTDVHKISDSTSLEKAGNHLFVTLLSGEFYKASEKNIEARLAVYDSSGRCIQNCFESATPDEGHTISSYYQSTVFYHEDKPKWNETAKIRLSEGISGDVHLRIALYSRRSDKNKTDKGPFAIAYAHILAGTRLISDGDHELLMYKVDPLRYNLADVSYLAFPSTRADLKLIQSSARPATLMEKNGICVLTRTRSTTLTHNSLILAILNWRMHQANLRHHLEKISSQEGLVTEEVVKFIPGFCDALFEIMDNHAHLHRQVFDVLVVVLRLVESEKNAVYKPILENYIRMFHSTIAYVGLITHLLYYIEHADETHEKSLPALKALGYLMQMIVASKMCNDRLEMATGSNFHEMIDRFKKALEGMMQGDRGRMTCQNVALKFLPTIIPELIQPGILEPREVTDFIISIMDKFGVNIVPRHRLEFIEKVVETELFTLPDCRETLLPKVLEKVLQHLQPERLIERTELAERIAKCSQILMTLLENLFNLPFSSFQQEEHDFSLVFGKCFRPLVQTCILNGLSERSVLQPVFTVVLALLNRISAEGFKQYVDALLTHLDKLDFLSELVRMFRDIFARSAYQKDWLLMFRLQNKVFVKTMRFIIPVVVGTFNEQFFEVDLWRECMLTLVAFITQEKFVDRKPAFLKRLAANELRSLWYQLPEVEKMNYIPGLVGSFLRVALSSNDVAIRESTIPIFFDMMQTEYHMSTPSEFTQFRDEMIVQLDSLVDDGVGDSAFRRQMNRLMMDRCRSNHELFTRGGIVLFIKEIDNLLQLLFDYRQVRRNSDSIENGMSRTVELIKYYHSIGQRDLYIAYVYKLYDLHLLCGNLVEAAFTLQNHASTLSWEEEELPPFVIAKQLNRQCASQRQLKEQLYIEMADLLDRGEIWEKSIEILKELIPVYEHRYIDYVKLSELLSRIADLYKKISSRPRMACSYFLVGFYGRGFPAYLNKKEFIFRGQPLDKLGSFQQRLLSNFYGSKLVPTMDDCSHLAKQRDRHIQIIAVRPIAPPCSMTENKFVNRLIRWYFEHNDVNKFEYTRPEMRQSKFTELENTEVTRLWIRKRYVGVDCALPSTLKFARVISHSEPFDSSPLTEAVATMERSNEALLTMAEEALQAATSMDWAKPLGGAVRGVLQANVQGGTKNYKVFFSEECHAVLTEEEHREVEKLGELLRNQVPILEYCLYVHSTLPKVDHSFHASLVESFYDYRQNIEEQFGAAPSILPPNCSIVSATPAPPPESLQSPSVSNAASLGSLNKTRVAFAALKGMKPIAARKSNSRCEERTSFQSESGLLTPRNSEFQRVSFGTTTSANSSPLRQRIRDSETSETRTSSPPPPPLPRRRTDLHSKELLQNRRTPLP